MFPVKRRPGSILGAMQDPPAVLLPTRRAPLLVLAVLVGWPFEAPAATYYVRQTVGDDAYDGTSPEKAWQHIAKLSAAMRAGDTAYVGPGLYREGIAILHDGTPQKRLILIADTTGQHTGDPPGAVMIAGSDPVDESIFVAHTAPRVYAAPAEPVGGVVELDGPQYRYRRADQTKAHVVEKRPPVEVVQELPSSYFYDQAARVLYVHTSDGKPPHAHEIELIHRGSGIAVPGRSHVTVMGFTVRHVGDAGINFWKTSTDGMAIDNTAYGSRQGIRVYNATNIFVYGNTLFRNDNSGVYFAAESVNGTAARNTAYENVKGVRWSSASANAVVIDNVLFDNHEAGIAIEKADGAIVRRNKVVNNKKYQLFVIESAYSSESNCFAPRGPGQLTADFLFTEHYRSLADYQRARGQDLHSQEGGCGPLPAKIDVRKLHAETMTYAERARRALSDSVRGRGAGTGTPDVEPGSPPK